MKDSHDIKTPSDYIANNLLVWNENDNFSYREVRASYNIDSDNSFSYFSTDQDKISYVVNTNSAPPGTSIKIINNLLGGPSGQMIELINKIKEDNSKLLKDGEDLYSQKQLSRLKDLISHCEFSKLIMDQIISGDRVNGANIISAYPSILEDEDREIATLVLHDSEMEKDLIEKIYFDHTRVLKCLEFYGKYFEILFFHMIFTLIFSEHSTLNARYIYRTKSSFSSLVNWGIDLKVIEVVPLLDIEKNIIMQSKLNVKDFSVMKIHPTMKYLADIKMSALQENKID